MNLKIIIGGIVLLAALVFGAVNFFESNVDYGDFADARKTQKKIQVKGEWMRDHPSAFDAQNIRFTFYLKDDSGEIEKVVLDGARPNNFELATSVVVKGKEEGGYFHATEVLTKCPSKYEGKTGAMKRQS